MAPDKAPLLSVQETMEAAGIHVARIEIADDDVHAISLNEPQSVPVVLLNARASRVREPVSRRAVLAHELCHVLHDSGERDVLTMISRAHAEDPLERRANAFAPAFIAPRSWLRPESATPEALVAEIATTWGLGLQGAIWHAKNARLISPETADQLVVQLSGLDVRGFEAEIHRTHPASVGLDCEVSPLVAGLLQEWVVAAYRQGHISAGRAREILTLG